MALQEKLAQEEANTRINIQKIDAQWRDILRKGTPLAQPCHAPHPRPEKAVQLHSELEILSQTFERVLDRKQAVIQTLVGDLVEAEQQVRCVGEAFPACPSLVPCRTTWHRRATCKTSIGCSCSSRSASRRYVCVRELA